MSVAKLIRKFVDSTVVPIDIDQQVIPAVRTLGYQGEIYWFYAETNTGLLKGDIEHWQYPDQDGNIHAVVDITVSSALSDDWKRLVACKEIVHILDTDDCRVATEQALENLIERLSLPTEMQDPLNDGKKVISDKIAVFQAVAVLFPMAARNELLAPYREGKLTISDIARLVDIPTRYVALVMSDVWDEVYPVLSAE